LPAIRQAATEISERNENVSEDITPASVMAGFWRWFGVGVLALALLAALIVGGWRAGWWFAAQNATRQNSLIQHGVSNQESQEAQMTSGISTVLNITTQMTQASGQELADLQAQRLGVARVACQNAAQITNIPAQQAGWVRQNCLDGTVNPASPLNQGN
jgi:hypothetical protein